MRIGDIYNFLGNRIRILMFDDNEVFYGIVDSQNVFYYANYKTVTYYRETLSYFTENAFFVGLLELTEKELEIHRPDLPLRLNCFSKIFWVTQPFKNQNDFKNFLALYDIKIEHLESLHSTEVIIYPTGQQLSNKKAILLENEIGLFTGNELLEKCFQIQSDYVKNEKPYFSRYRLIPNGREEKRLSGIGIYRLGIKGNIPSYSLGGSMSFMELGLDNSLIV